MLLFLYGKDTFRSRHQLKKMIEKFRVDRDPAGYNVVKIDATIEKEPNRIKSEILASPFLAEKRLIVVESLLMSKHKELQTDLLKRIEDNKLPETNIVIFWEGVDSFKTKEAKALFERLQTEKFCQNFEELAGVKLNEWIEAEVKARQGKIARAAIFLIAENCKGDTWQASAIIDQVTSYKAGAEIVVADVKLFLEEKFDDNIFNLVDAIIAGQQKKARGMIEEQYRKGEDVQFIFAMLLRQYRILLEIRDLLDREDGEDGMVSDVMAKKLELHPFVVKKSMPLVKRQSMEKLRTTYRGLLDLDKKIKTGQSSPETLLDIFTFSQFS